MQNFSLGLGVLLASAACQQVWTRAPQSKSSQPSAICNCHESLRMVHESGSYPNAVGMERTSISMNASAV